MPVVACNAGLSFEIVREATALLAIDLDDRLRRRGVERLILFGVTTQCCVSSTLREAVDRGFRCLTVEDACAATTPAG